MDVVAIVLAVVAVRRFEDTDKEIDSWTLLQLYVLVGYNQR